VGDEGARVKGYDPTTYGERIAHVYDEWFGQVEFPSTEPAVDFLAELAGPRGRALELAIGTGRIALPLAERGVEVHGIDTSEVMVAKLRDKPGGDRIPVTMGDFADVAVEGTFGLVYVVFNTFFALLSQDEQVRCFANVAARLGEGGLFVLEAFVPDPTRFAGGRVSVSKVEADRVQLDLNLLDVVEQRSDAQRLVIGPEGFRLYPTSIRWAYPSELDLMARLARLQLRERLGGWQREPFTARSEHHVSVYESADG
jgi:SAM-dependent methyltransferase